MNGGAPLEGQHLVYSAPTGAGKTAVAEILLLHRIALHGGFALVVLPFKSLCIEQAERLRRLLAPWDK